LRLWKLLLNRGHVAKGQLAFEPFMEACFEMADASVTNEKGALLRPFDGDMGVRMQEFYEFVQRMLRKMQFDHARAAADMIVHVLDGEGEGLLRRRGVVATDPSLMPGEEAARLKHCWPPFDTDLPEIIRKLGLLQRAISNVDGSMNRNGATREFAAYCRLARTSQRTLSYVAMDTALRKMPGDSYRDLMFRYAVVGREGSSVQALRDANRVDAEQMLCFLRYLDDDCDGYVSQKDFTRVVLGKGEVKEICELEMKKLAERWVLAAEALANQSSATRRLQDAAKATM